MLWSIAPVPDLAAAISHARTLRGTALLDLDGTLGPTGIHLSEVAVADSTLAALCASQAPTFVIVTNRSHLDPGNSACTAIVGAHKPFTSRHRLPVDVSCVIGDQLLTDGLLAARLQVPLIHLPSADTDRRPLARWGDRWLKHFFREANEHGARD